MCFNSTVSIITYIVGLTGSYQLYQYQFTPEAIFYGWVIQMQLLEYFLWKNQPCGTDIDITTTNQHITNLANVVNHLEPFILWIAILHFSKSILPDYVNQYMYVFAIITGLYTYNTIKNSMCTTVTEESKPHLHWKWNNGKHYIPFYLLFLFTLLFLSYHGLEYPRNLINCFIILISYLISYKIYGDKHSVGAMWCFIAAFAPWLLIFLYKNLNITSS